MFALVISAQGFKFTQYLCFCFLSWLWPSVTRPSPLQSLCLEFFSYDSLLLQWIPVGVVMWFGERDTPITLWLNISLLVGLCELWPSKMFLQRYRNPTTTTSTPIPYGTISNLFPRSSDPFWLYIFPLPLRWDRKGMEEFSSSRWDKAHKLFPGGQAFVMEKVMAVFHNNYSYPSLVRSRRGSFSDIQQENLAGFLE